MLRKMHVHSIKSGCLLSDSAIGNEYITLNYVFLYPIIITLFFYSKLWLL